MADSTDILHLSSFYSEETAITKIAESENEINIYLKSKIHEQECPGCGKKQQNITVPIKENCKIFRF